MVSFVIPVFKSPGSLQELCSRIAGQMKHLGLEWEIVFVVDGEGGNAWQGYLDEIRKYQRARAILLSRNIGQHAAIRFGLSMAKGDLFYIMDCDLQDPPEIIPEVLAPLCTGAVDVVLTHRLGQHSESSWKSMRRLYNRIAEIVTGLDIHYALGPVTALSSRAAEYVTMFKEEAHTLQILMWLRMPSTVVYYERCSRPSGRSSYSLKSRIRHAVSGLSFSTARLLAFVFVASFALASAAVSYLGFLLYLSLTGTPPDGWLSLITVSIVGFASIAMLVSFTGGLVIQALNIARQRPTAIVIDMWNTTISESRGGGISE